MGRRRILIVDDDPGIVQALVEYLARRGFEVRGTTSTSEAVGLLSNGFPDVVISDVCMPCGGAPVILEHLAASGAGSGLARAGSAEGGAGPALVVMSGTEIELAEHLLRTGGAAAFLHKPFRMADLLAALDAVGGRPLAPQGARSRWRTM
ncbi:MAG: response regulator [Acidobacteriota bacterium]